MCFNGAKCVCVLIREEMRFAARGKVFDEVQKIVLTCDPSFLTFLIFLHAISPLEYYSLLSVLLCEPPLSSILLPISSLLLLGIYISFLPSSPSLTHACASFPFISFLLSSLSRYLTSFFLPLSLLSLSFNLLPSLLSYI